MRSLTAAPVRERPPAGAGLPVGVMLAARPAEEELRLGLAVRLERVEAARGRAWGEVHPPGW